MILQLLFMEILGWYNVIKVDHVVVVVHYLFFCFFVLFLFYLLTTLTILTILTFNITYQQY